MLNERAQILLKTLVERHICDGQPIGSRALQQYSGLDVSSATIRNVMVDLEHVGLVASPHTSAGRVPTARAYRLFVDTMLVVKPLESQAVQDMASKLQPDNPSRLIMQASHVLSDLTRFAGVVATTRKAVFQVQQIEFLRLGEKRVLLIIVMLDGEVENRVLMLGQDYPQSQLTEAANFFNAHYQGRGFSEIRTCIQQELQVLRQNMSELMSALLKAGDAVEHAKMQGCAVTGEGNLLNVEDFSSDIVRLRGLFDLFDKKNDLLHLLEAGCHGQGIQLFIGGESGVASLDECSVVTAPYSCHNQQVGRLAVIGPKRMDYKRVIPIVDMAARLLSNALSQH